MRALVLLPNKNPFTYTNMSAQLEIVEADVSGLRNAKPPEEEFAGMAELAAKLTCEGASIVVSDSTQKEAMEQARSYRLVMVKLRGQITKKHKELKEFYLNGGRKIDALKKSLVDALEQEEARLLACEQFAEREAARIRAELEASRKAELAPYEFPGAASMILAGMSGDEFANLLESAAEMQRSRKAAAARLEEERVAAESEAAAARARLFEENARMRKYVEDQKRETAILQQLANEEAAKARALSAAHAAELERVRKESAASLAALAAPVAAPGQGARCPVCGGPAKTSFEY